MFFYRILIFKKIFPYLLKYSNKIDNNVFKMPIMNAPMEKYYQRFVEKGWEIINICSWRGMC